MKGGKGGKRKENQYKRLIPISKTEKKKTIPN